MATPVNSVPMMQTYRSVIITNSNGDKFEITSAVAELNIFEDIASNFLTGNLLYIDDHGGMTDIGFNGNEKLTVELYKRSDAEEVTSHDFFVYLVSDAERINDGTSSYILHFSSVEAILNKNTKVYSAIEGSCTDAVKKLYRFIGSEKALETEDTSGVYKFVMPSISPLDCINWYAGRSISSESGGSYFLFYETLERGFAFKCVDTLVEKEPTFVYRYEPAGNQFLVKDVSNIREYEVLQAVNTLEGFDEQYNTLWNSDALRKKIVKQQFDFDSDKKSTLNRGSSVTESSSKNGFDIDLADRRKAFGTTVIVRNEVRNTHSSTQSYYYDAIQPKLAAMRQYNGLRLRFLAFGNRELRIGQTIQLNFMKTKMYDAETKSESEDKLLSGKYLITAIRYIYRINTFDMAIEVVKDSKAQ